MENFCRGAFIGLAIGMCVGGIVVAKNKKLAGKIKEGLSTAEDKIQEAKEMIEEKIQESKEDSESNNNSTSMESNPFNGQKTEQMKKSKN